MPPYTLGQIAVMLNCAAPPGGADRVVTGMATLQDAGDGDLAALGEERYLKQFAKTRAAGVIVSRKVKLPSDVVTPTLVVENADLAMALVLERYAPPIARPACGVDPGARISTGAVLGSDVAIGFGAFIGQRSRVGAGTAIHAGVYVGDDVVIGENCQLFPGTVIRERITIGHRVIIHAGSVLGTDGFGYRWDGAAHIKIPQIGTVIVEDDVEIGSCVCIDRAKFGATRIGHGAKIDNLVQIAHNVEVGPHCIIVSLCGVAGSAKLGAGVVLGGGTAIRDHITLGDGAMVGARGGVAQDVPPKTIVSGSPAVEHRQYLREMGAIRKLPDMRIEMRKLQEEIDAIKKRLDA